MPRMRNYGDKSGAFDECPDRLNSFECAGPLTLILLPPLRLLVFFTIGFFMATYFSDHPRSTGGCNLFISFCSARVPFAFSFFAQT